MRFLRKYSILAILFLPACLSLSKKEREEHLISVPLMTKSVQEAVNSSFFTEGQWPSQVWWELFGSTELHTLIAKALVHNPSIQAIEKRVAAAREESHVVRSKLYPLISFDANETWQHVSHNGIYRALNPTFPIDANLVDLTLSFSYEFDFWNKYRNLFRASLGRERAWQAEAKEVELIVTTSLAIAYFALKTNLIREALYKALVNVRKSFYDLEKSLEKSALLSRLEPLFGEERFLESEKFLAAIQSEIKTNIHLINILIGVGPDSPLEIDSKLPEMKKLTLPATLSSNLLSRRPDLMTQIWRVEALAYEVGAAKADFFPDVNLIAFAGLESITYGKLMTGSSFTDGLKPAINLPIFTAGAIRSNIRAKKALFDQAVFEYNDLILKSAQEVTDLIAFATSVFKQKEEQDRIVKAAETRLMITVLRKARGLDSLLDIYKVQEEVIEKELGKIDLIYQKFLVCIKLIKALGGGYTAELPLQKETP